MRRILFLMATTAAVLAAMLTGFGVAQAAPAAPAAAPTAVPAAARCGQNGTLRDGRVVTATRAVSIRTGSSTGCPARGAIEPGDRLTYYCYTNDAGRRWTFLRDQRTGVLGWALGTYLPSGGSAVGCGLA